MSFTLSTLLLVSVCYIALITMCVWMVDKGIIPRSFTQNSVCYIFSLGVYASSWSYYGSVAAAYDDGYGFLAFYFGLGGAFFLAPLLLKPILEKTQKYQLLSLPDLCAFCFKSPLAGVLATVLLVVTVMPLLAFQIQSVSRSVYWLNNSISTDYVAFLFSLLMIFLSIYIGAKKSIVLKKDSSLVFVVAFETFFNLIIMIVLIIVIVKWIFGGFFEIGTWLKENQHLIQEMRLPPEQVPWRTYLLMFFASAVVAPHMFHMTFTENKKRASLIYASWGFPLLILLFSIVTPLVLWSGIKINSPIPPAYFSLMIGAHLESDWLTLLVYIGGFSAGCGLTVVTVLALTSMLLNHLVFPWSHSWQGAGRQFNVYQRVVWLRRIVITLIILISYCFFIFMESVPSFNRLMVVSYSGMLQLFPAIVCILYKRKYCKYGFSSGFCCGVFVWFWLLLLPLLLDWGNIPWGEVIIKNYVYEYWYVATTLSLVMNGLVFFIVSTLNREERNITDTVTLESKTSVYDNEIRCSVESIEDQLRVQLGVLGAEKEVSRALSFLSVSRDETRPSILYKLCRHIENNLSGFLGPTVAYGIINAIYPEYRGSYQEMHVLESRLEAYQYRMTGMVAELDSLRRYYRQILNGLPLAMYSLNSEDVIVLWNAAMVSLTNIEVNDVIDAPLSSILPPWRDIIQSIAENDLEHLNNQVFHIDGKVRFFNMHKAHFTSFVAHSHGNCVVLIEDQTENRMLEEQLVHKERLASIGQLAAGIAHEIGNPITGISCLAQELPELTNNKEVSKVGHLIREQTERVSAIVQTLVTYAHSGRDSLIHGKPINNVSVNDCVKFSIALLQLGSKNNRVSFENLCDPVVQVKANKQKLEQVFINILKNAIDASPDGGVVQIGTIRKQDSVVMFVEDAGVGIPKSMQEHIFDPFFTTKQVGLGTGLGLALVWNIVHEYDGAICVFSPLEEGKGGTRFEVSLPFGGVA